MKRIAPNDNPAIPSWPALVTICTAFALSCAGQRTGSTHAKDSAMSNPLLTEEVNSAVFHPRPDVGGPAARAGSSELFVEVEPGARLRLRTHRCRVDDAPLILFFHGNGETATDYDDLAASFTSIPAHFVAADYRGYGTSTGRPDLENLLTDAHRVLDATLRWKVENRLYGKLVVMGRSLGSAPALELSAKRSGDLAAVIIESGFARIVPLLELMGIDTKKRGITEDHGPKNEAKMRESGLPSLVIHADGDQIIPLEEGKRLHAASGDTDKMLYIVSGAGHNDIQLRAGRRYFEKITEFLQRLR